MRPFFAAFFFAAVAREFPIFCDRSMRDAIKGLNQAFGHGPMRHAIG
jgi:hypothetical protein